MKRTKFLHGLSVLVVLGLLYSCNQRQSSKSEKFNPEFGNYINAYTTGVISTQSEIKVVLQHKVELDGKQAGEMLEMDLFEFSPKIKGSTYLEDNHTIRFVPDELMKSKETYSVKFALHKLFKVDKDLSYFEFQFAILGQSFQVTKVGFSPYSNDNLENYFIEGYVTAADFMLEEDAAKLLKARQGSKILPVRWEYQDNPKKFPFYVDSIVRSEAVVPVLLFWDGDPLNIDISGTDTTRISALGDFKVGDIKVIQQPEQYVKIQFSDPILESQNLDGIIRMDGGMKLKFEIKSNTVLAYPDTRIAGAKTIRIEPGIKNILGYKMKSDYFMELSFEDIKP